MRVIPLETPVTVSCDRLGCPEVLVTMTQTSDRTDDIPDVRRRAADAGMYNARAAGWSVAADGSAYCPLHVRGRLVLP